MEACTEYGCKKFSDDLRCAGGTASGLGRVSVYGAEEGAANVVGNRNGWEVHKEEEPQVFEVQAFDVARLKALHLENHLN